jgi:hypothetical protein
VIDLSKFFDAGGFTFRFPLFMLGHPDGTMGGLLKAAHKDGSVSLPMFTEEDLARSFRAAGPEPESYALMSVDMALSFLGLLLVLESKGFTHVLFDPNRDKGFSIAIDGLRRLGLTWFP